MSFDKAASVSRIDMSSLRVLVVHNAYQLRGGEDSVVDAEVALLRERGHSVALLARHNDEINQLSRPGLVAQTLWSKQTFSQITQQVKLFRPDVIHVHNTLPLVSPSVFWAAAKHKVPVVQTLHNFRLLCPQATFLREGRVCEDCLGRTPWPAVMHRCYRDSAVQTGVVAAMLSLHRNLGTFRDRVTRYIALNEFCKSKFVQGGLPADRVDVKPNFVDWTASLPEERRSGGLYVGRLSVEKGIHVLAQAMNMYAGHSVRVMGGGPLEEIVRQAAGDAFQGAVPLDQVRLGLQGAAYLVLPSVCFEGFPRTLVEAFACGTPVIASRHGSMAELVKDGETGLLFEPGHPADLADRLKWADAHPQKMREMGRAARREYERLYTPDKNAKQLLDIYRRAMATVEAEASA